MILGLPFWSLWILWWFHSFTRLRN